jgi:hypothetical protein
MDTLLAGLLHPSELIRDALQFALSYFHGPLVFKLTESLSSLTEGVKKKEVSVRIESGKLYRMLAKKYLETPKEFPYVVDRFREFITVRSLNLTNPKSKL